MWARPKTSADRIARPSQPWWRWLHIVTIASFAIAQPLYDMISREPNFLVAHDIGPVDLILFSISVSLVFPALLAGLGLLVSVVSQKASLVIDLFMIAALATLIVLQVFHRIGPAGWLMTIAAVILGLVVSVVYHRFGSVRKWVTALTPAVVLFPVVFLFFSPVQRLMIPATVESVQSEVTDGPHVVFVIFDELPVTSLMNEKRTIDTLRYPAFADLAQTSHWFRNATTVAPYTLESIPAMLTGRIPVERRLATLNDFPENLFTILGGTYDVKAVETISHLCPEELNLARAPSAPIYLRLTALLTDSAVAFMHVVTPSMLATGLPPVSQGWRDFTGSPTILANDPYSRANDSAWVFQYFLDQITATQRPTLLFLHCTVPHPPWQYMPSGKQYGPVGLPKDPYGLNDEVWGDDDVPVLHVWQRHLFQVQYADRLLARLLAQLRDAGIFEQSLIIVTSDHGSAFRAGEARRPINEGNAADVLSIPLFIKQPEQVSGSINDRSVQTTDILPTIAECLGIDIPWPVDGQSVFDPNHRPKKVEAMINGPDWTFGPFFLDQEHKYRTLRDMINHFGTGANPNGLFSYGPYDSLVGKNIAELGIVQPSLCRAVLEQDWAFDDVDPESSFVPSRIVGRLTGVHDESDELLLAIAVNGVVRTTTSTFGKRGDTARFFVMVPENSFTAGPNHVEIFVVSGEVGRPALAPVEIGTSTTCRLSGKDPNEVITCSDGWRSDVVPLAVRGKVHFRGRVVHGWAADILGGMPAERVMVFRGRELLLETSTGEYQFSFARRDERLAYCGFEFLIQESILDVNDFDSLRFFAVSGTSTSNLHIMKD